MFGLFCNRTAGGWLYLTRNSDSFTTVYEISSVAYSNKIQQLDPETVPFTKGLSVLQAN